MARSLPGWLIIQVSNLQIPEGLVWAIPLALLLPKVMPRIAARLGFRKVERGLGRFRRVWVN